MTYRIFFACTRTRSSRVEIPSRRAASAARSGSAGTAASLGIVESQSTAEPPDLVLKRNNDGKLPAGNESVPSILQRREERERLLKPVLDRIRRLAIVGRRRQCQRRMVQASPRGSPVGDHPVLHGTDRQIGVLPAGRQPTRRTPLFGQALKLVR